MQKEEFIKVAAEIDTAFFNFKKKVYLILTLENWNNSDYDIEKSYFDWSNEVKYAIDEYLNKYQSENLIKKEVKRNIELLKGIDEKLFKDLLCNNEHPKLINPSKGLSLINDNVLLVMFLNETLVNIEKENELIYSNTDILKNKILLIQQKETKTDNLKAVLGKYGFFELPKVKSISGPNKEKLVELLSSNELPYCIAMFDFLGYLKHLEREHFKTKYKLNRQVSTWFNSDKDGRSVKGNISTLSGYGKEDKKKYTAHTHKETVQKDYQKLK